MRKLLIPQISRSDLPPIIGVALLGGLIGGAYGIIHDQVTYAISPEYFTKLKFPQFQYADFGLGDSVFVSTIGFLATWWVGLIGAWFLARRLIPNQPRDTAYRQICAGIIVIFLFGLSFGVCGYALGLWRGPTADYSSWNAAFHRFHVSDKWAFVRVGYIHNAGYIGGLLGLIVALTTIRPHKNQISPPPDEPQG